MAPRQFFASAARAAAKGVPERDRPGASKASGAVCATCAFFVSDPRPTDVTGGACRRRAPRASQVAGRGVAFWPRVRHVDWCGEYVRAEDSHASS
jgi:hypothetical protein